MREKERHENKKQRGPRKLVNDEHRLNKKVWREHGTVRRQKEKRMKEETQKSLIEKTLVV